MTLTCCSSNCNLKTFYGYGVKSFAEQCKLQLLGGLMSLVTTNAAFMGLRSVQLGGQTVLCLARGEKTQGN